MNNNAGTFEGGVIYLILFSQIVLNPGTHINFTNNTGRLLDDHVDFACSYIRMACVRTCECHFLVMLWLCQLVIRDT